MNRSVFSFPTTIVFGPGVRRELAHHLRELGVSRALVVTDRQLVALPIFQALVEDLEETGLPHAAYHGIAGNPVKRHVEEGVACFRDGACDGIVAFGGGAAIDVAKAIAMKTRLPGDLFDHAVDRPGFKPTTEDLPPMVALPTTAGTGSEVGRSAVISDDVTHVKRILFSPKLLPRVVLADPELTFDLPPKVTAATGMDALTHCVEAWLSRGYHPMCDGIALEGVRLIAGALPRAVEHPHDPEARSAMLMAAMMGAVAFQKGLGVVHSCAHALSTVHDLHHGLANGLMIPFCMDHNGRQVPERFGRLCEAAGIEGRDPAAFVTWLTTLRARIGIPASLADLGLAPSSELVEVAWKDPCHAENPVDVTRQDLVDMFTAAAGVGSRPAVPGGPR